MIAGIYRQFMNECVAKGLHQRRMIAHAYGLGAGAALPVAGFALRVPWRSTWLAVAHSPMMVALPLKRLFTRASSSDGEGLFLSVGILK